MPRYKRTRLLIDKIQYRLLWLQLVYFLALILIFTSTIFLPLIFRLESGAISLAERQEVASEFLSLHTRLWPAVVMLFVLLSIHSVFVSHRIAGPLFRFRKVLGAVAKGDLSVRLTLRKNDYLVKEGESVDAMILALRDRVLEVKTGCSELDARLAEAEATVAHGSAAQIRQKMEALRAQTDRLRATVDEFQTDNRNQQPKLGAEETLATPEDSELPSRA
jgi:methyl-accepting chemotaxis protein